MSEEPARAQPEVLLNATAPTGQIEARIMDGLREAHGVERVLTPSLDAPMQFLFLTTKYPTELGDSWLASDLVAELAHRGHTIEVLLLDWDAPHGARTVEVRSPDGIRVVKVAPKSVGGLGTLVKRVSKFVLGSRHAAREMDRHFDLLRFAAIIAFTPALTLAGPIRKICRAGILNRILFVFDFFPMHHREIGMIPSGPVYQVAKWAEWRLYRTFTTIICNLPRNITYLRRNFRLPSENQIISTPLWSDVSPLTLRPREVVLEAHGLPADRPIAIFGGQITDGRGIELMLNAAEHAASIGSPLLFLFVGNGRLEELVRTAEKRSDSVRLVSGLDRDSYLDLASACDVGLVATVPGVSSFSFPTKTIDYLRAGLPVVAAVEPGSDYLDILTRHAVGTGVTFGHPAAFFRAVETLVEDRDMRAAMLERSRKCLNEVFHVRHAADALLRSIEHSDSQRKETA